MDLTGATLAFDLDGTLVETAPDLIGALNAMLRERGLPEVEIGAARHLVGRGARKLIEHGFAEAGAPLQDEDLARLTEDFVELYRARIAQESRPFPGVVEALEHLRRQGAKLAVCTNKRTDLSVSLLDALGMRQLFAAIVGPDLVSARKPSGAHLLETIALAGGAPDRAVMIGDSEPDFLSARAAGVPVILVSFGYSAEPAALLRPDAMLDHFPDLPAEIDRLLG